MQSPYIIHPVGVANILMHEAGVTDIEVLIAAILHDTIEDTDTTSQEIESLFGVNILNIVLEVTDDKSLPSEQRKKLQITKAPFKSDQAKLVKLGDKIYNLRDLTRNVPKGWGLERVQVCKGLQGLNEYLDAEVERLTDPETSTFVFTDGKTYPYMLQLHALIAYAYRIDLSGVDAWVIVRKAMSENSGSVNLLTTAQYAAASSTSDIDADDRIPAATVSRPSSNHRENFYFKSVQWSPDGTCMLTNSTDNILRIFETSDALVTAEEGRCNPINSAE
ncbi:Guanosine-3',5'-bis(diphosphate) 3'-pyrophosphohydrolase MESH1 [Chytridiales sp. JEL 0842]|nr:Guanosine-3',5'-bis(diphosphate) 3'-pyrophosphohydrolase MESH1 [Chytridiales sp. JEL 0842]